MAIVFSPHITSPKGDEIFNLGTVTIKWDKNDPPSDDEYGAITTANVSYEIEYTDNYKADQTTWYVVKRRISWADTSFAWNVGKSIKSKNVRIRIRARTSIDGTISDWSMISGDFAINVFELVPPAITNPLPNRVYNDFVLIILDETITQNTYHQKVRYTLEYASEKRGISFTLIANDIPVGQNVIRWNTENLTPSDDYVLRLTVKNVATSCFENEAATPDQIARRYVYNIILQQAGMFVIDTKPPTGLLNIEEFVSGITNQLSQTVNIFAEDVSTEVRQIQLRECDATQDLGLGNIEEEQDPIPENQRCKTVEEILEAAGELPDFDRIIGKPVGHSSKTQWTFDDRSGVRKIEAMFTDAGGNTSLQENAKIFQTVYKSDARIFDFILTVEQRDNVRIEVPDDPSQPPVVVTEPALFEVAFIATEDGEYWILEPHPRLVYVSAVGRSVQSLITFNSVIYILTYLNTEIFRDIGSVFRDDKTQPTLLFNFPNAKSITTSVAQFGARIYIGLENGELWSYDGLSFLGLHTFTGPISTLHGDEKYLYIGFENSPLLTLYNGTEFFTLDMNPVLK